MKRTYKLLITLLVLSALLAAVSLAVFAEGESYTGTVSGLETYVNDIDPTSSKVVAKIDAAEAYLATVDPASAGYGSALDALVAKERDSVNAFLTASADSNKFDTKRTALIACSNVIAAATSLKEDDSYADLASAVNAEAKVALELALDGAKAAESADDGANLLYQYVELASKFTEADPEDGLASKRTDASLTVAERYLDGIAAANNISDAYLLVESYCKLCGELSLTVTEDNLLAKQTASAQGAIRKGIDGLDFGQVALTKIRINKMNRIVKLCGVTDATLLGDLDEASRRQAEASAALREREESRVSFDEQDWNVDFDSDFEDNSPMPTHGNDQKDGANKFEKLVTPDGNTCLLVAYVEKELTEFVTSQNTYAVIALADSRKGMVFELDFTTFGQLPDDDIAFSSGENSLTSGTRVFPRFGTITTDGAMRAGDSKAPYILGGEAVIVPGEWIRIGLVYDPDTYTIKLYLENELMATYSCAKEGGYNLYTMRIGTTATSGEFCFDNLKAYQGTGFRTHGKLAAMTDEELLDYYTAAMVNEELALNIRVQAYDRVTAMLGKWWNGETNGYIDGTAEGVKADLEVYFAFPINDVVDALKQYNLDTLTAMLQELRDLGRSLTNISDRENVLSIVDRFVQDNGSYIPTEAEGYGECMRIINQARSEITVDTNINAFIAAIGRFNTAVSSKAKRNNYLEAVEAYNLGVDLLLIDPSSPSYDPDYSAFAEAYATYLAGEEIILGTARAENSDKVLDCMEFLRSFGTDLSVWEANYDAMETYVVIVRDIVRDQEIGYDPSAKGMDEALEIFGIIDEYFYERLQIKHIAHIEEKLTAFGATDSYIEKVGIVAYIQRYLDKNDIDSTNPDIIDILARYEACREQIAESKDEYDAMLSENSRKFIEAVAALRNADGYAQRKAIYEEAVEYYYMMNMSGDGIDEALAYFDQAEQMLKKTEEVSECLINTAAMLKITDESDRDEIYALLVEGLVYSVDADGTIEGVTEAKAELQAASDSYNAHISAVNGELTHTVTAVGSLRANTGFAELIATLIANILG